MRSELNADYPWPLADRVARSGRPETDTDARQPPVTYRVYSDRQTVTTKNSIAN